MTLLTREQILKANDIKTETVPVPEWDGTVLVRGMTGVERDAYEATMMRVRGTDVQMNFANARAKLVAATVIDANGARLFADEDVALLAQKSAAALDRVFAVAQRLSGITKADLEDLTKNSDSGQSDDSGIG